MPGILAYDAYVNERNIIFAKGKITWRFRHTNKDIDLKFNQLLEDIESLIPNIKERIEGTSVSSRLQHSITDKIKERIREFKQSHKLHNHSFWNLCALFYGASDPEKIIIPDSKNFPFYTEYSRRKMIDLEQICRKQLNRFATNNAEHNNIVQVPQENPPNNTNENYFTLYKWAKRESFSFEETESLGKDLLASFLGLNYFENKIYFELSQNQYDFLPMIDCELFNTFFTFLPVFNSLNGIRDEFTVMYEALPETQMIWDFNNIFFSQNYVYLRSIFNYNFTYTENAHIILNHLNEWYFRHPNHVYTLEGLNLWNLSKTIGPRFGGNQFF